jgi:2-keto-3-deoxy-L-rhamnonate aldolase RhmA
MSRGWNTGEHTDSFKDAEREMIEVALQHGVQPRCEIHTPEAAQYYIDLGVRHFNLGDQLTYLLNQWDKSGTTLREQVANL